MSLISSVTGFAAFGVLVRSYALGLQKRNVLSNPSGYAITAGAFGAFGYFTFNLQERQSNAIAAKRQVMVQNRKRAEELAASA